MLDRIGFIGKILLLSAVVSLAIKYLLPAFSLSPTSLNVLIAILTPTILTFIVLWRRSSQL